MRHSGLLQMSRGRSCREQQQSASSVASAVIPGGPAVSSGGLARHLPGAARSHRRRKPLHRLRGLSCAGSWCKPQVLSSDVAGPTPSVCALAANMLQRGWVTREEYAQLLLGDRLYCLHEAAQEEERQRQRGLARKLSKKSRPNVANGIRVRAKMKKRKKAIGAMHAPTKPSVETKTERPVAPCRDPITLDDLGSWTWDFRASEAATPPVSCGAPAAPKSGSGDAGDGGGGGGGGWGSRGRRGRGKAECDKGECGAVVTYNVESLVLYLLESGDFQEPTTRRPFSLVQLADLDALAARAGAKVKGSLVKSYHEGQAKYRERREQREMLVGADRCLGDVVTEMLSTIEDSDDPHEEAHVYLVTLFPQFAHIFSELKEADEEFARQCLDQYKSTLRGPPNCPTLEQGGLLRTALEFLCEQGGGGGGGEGDSLLLDGVRDGDFENNSTGGVIGDPVDAEDEGEVDREDEEEAETSSDDGDDP